MALGLIGQKVGMTTIFDEEGRAVPVTVVHAGPCVVVQKKTTETDGYEAVQLGYGSAKAKRLTKGQLGHLKKGGVEGNLPRVLREFRTEGEQKALEVGEALTVEFFAQGQLVDVVGTSIGRGFAGLQKRWNAGRGPMTHGSKFHRHPGSIGAGTTPSRVYKGRKMAGRLGGKRITVRKLTVAGVDTAQNLLLIKGAVPGHEGGTLIIRPTTLVGARKK